MMRHFRKYRRLFFPLLGAGGGFLYYYFIGCASGTCPISSNPYISTLYGAGVGFLLAWSANEKKPHEKS